MVLSMTDPAIREPDQIRRDAARKLRSVQVSEHFQAILGCLLGEDWTTPRLVEMMIARDVGSGQEVGHFLGQDERRQRLPSESNLQLEP